MKRFLMIISFMTLNVFELFLILNYLKIFTSPFKIFPWYDYDSIVFLAVFLYFPVCLIIAALLTLLNKGLGTSITNSLLPLVTGGGFVLITLFIDTFFMGVVYTGICFGVVMFFGVLTSLIRELLKLKIPCTNLTS